MNTWRKPRAFVCPYCEQDFRKERSLKMHVKDTHKKEKFIQHSDQVGGEVLVETFPSTQLESNGE
jgi:hypothetical protein